MPEPVIDEAFRQRIISAVTEAGERLLELWPGGNNDNSELVIKAKADGTLVSTADFASNDILVAALGQLMPEAEIFSEEIEQQTEYGRFVWIIDPLDGTHHFLEGKDDFAIQVALSDNGRIIASCMHYPALGITLAARKGAPLVSLGTEARVSDARSFAPRRVYSRGFSSSEQHIVSTDAKNSQYGLLGLCRAEFDAVVLWLEPLGEYDIASSVLIIEQLGGRVSDQRGGELLFAQSKPLPEYMLASNGVLHDQLLALLPS